MGEIKIDNNLFDNCRKGCNINKAVNTSINNNTLTNFSMGIGLYDGYPVGSSIVVCCMVQNDILGNHFNAGSTYPIPMYGITAIDVQNANPVNTNTTVSSNDMLNTAIGIHARNSSSIKIGLSSSNHNTYEAQLPATDIGTHGGKPAHYGIWVENSISASVLNNDIRWNPTIAAFPNSTELKVLKGIAVSSSTRCIIKENKTTSMGAGINFLGVCSATNLYCNTMETCYHGTYLQDVSTVVTDQGTTTESWNNKWVSNVGPTKVDGNAISPFVWYYYIPAGPLFDPQPCNTFLVNAQPAGGSNSCTAPLGPMDEVERENAFGETVRDSMINDPDSTYFKYASDAAFIKVAKTDSSFLDLNVPSDPLYQNKFTELEQSNIGKYEVVKDSLAAGNKQAALQKLALIIDQNLIEENKKYVSSLIAVDYDPSLDADSDTIAVLINIAYMHPFYGGEAVYWARAILHLDIEDVLPAMRMGHTQQQNIGSYQQILKGSFHPNPASSEVIFTYPFSETEKTEIRIFDTYGKELARYKLTGSEIKFSISSYLQAIYFIHVYVNDLEKETHRLAIIK